MELKQRQRVVTVSPSKSKLMSSLSGSALIFTQNKINILKTILKPEVFPFTNLLYSLEICQIKMI